MDKHQAWFVPFDYTTTNGTLKAKTTDARITMMPVPKDTTVYGMRPTGTRKNKY